MRKFIFIIFLSLFFVGCFSVFKKPEATSAGTYASSQSKQDSLQANMQTSPSISSYYSEIPSAEGALWSEDQRSLFSDRRARKVGDTLVVDIVEKSSSSLKANTSAEKENDIDLGISKFFGLMRSVGGKNKYLERQLDGSDSSTLAKSDYDSKFEGTGSINRTGEITASIGSIVKEVFPNGDLFIYGRRELQVNNETQFIIISGRVRPMDISEDNRIQSTYMADAKIEYSGKGILANKQKQGWLSSILDKIWPF